LKLSDETAFTLSKSNKPSNYIRTITVIRNANRPPETRTPPIVATFLEVLGLDDEVLFTGVVSGIRVVDKVLPLVIELPVMIVGVSVPLEAFPVVSMLPPVDLAVALPVMDPRVRVASVAVQ
jgi:hypothetical protein